MPSAQSDWQGGASRRPTSSPARRKIATSIVITLAVIILAASLAAWPRGTRPNADAVPDGGDPGGQLLARLVPLVRVVPGFETGHIPWISCSDGCNPSVPYATKSQPSWDGQDGLAGTFGWDPAVIEIGFQWTGGAQALVKLLNARLSIKGWELGAEPCWGDDFGGVATWDYSRGAGALEAFALDSPIESGQWQVVLQAKPQGRSIGC